jgi:transposase InsO family protein
MEIRTYLKNNILPDGTAFADRITYLAKRYTLVEGDLYRCGVNGVLIRCITREEGCELLTEVHGGECGNHASSHTLIGKAFQHGFYWLIALQDAIGLVKTCKACQFHAKQIHMPTWPFAVWGLYIVGPFPRVVGGYQFLYVAIDKFTKWPEATLVVKINNQLAVKFIKSIICRFRVPKQIITDNGSQFTSGAFQGYCEDLGIQICYVSLAHPESNGQVERANAEILKGLKIHTYDGLKKHGKKWIDELPCVLWGNRISPSRGTEETSFFMVYGAEVVLPLKVTMCSLCVKTYDEATQDQLRHEDIDLVDERRWLAAIKNAHYWQALRCYHQRFMRSRELQVDDLVLRRVLSREGMNKLSPCWEGPYRVTQVCRPGCV